MAVGATGTTAWSDDEAPAREIQRLEARVRSLEDALSRQCRIEETLRLREQEAARGNRAKDAFLAVLSHELRTPLNAILGWCQMIRGAQADDFGRDRGLQVIERNARLQVQIIDDLLDSSRMLSGKMQVRSQPVDLRQVLLAAMDGIRPALDRKPRDVRVTIADDLGVVIGDAGRLQQVVCNLLSNAIKFTPDAGVVSLSAARAGSEIRIVVRDTGRGIVADSLPHLFEPFWQADASGLDVPGGLGVGLAVVRYLVDAHGGTVAAESDGEGRGATFTVTLPAAPAPDAATTGERRARRRGRPTPR